MPPPIPARLAALRQVLQRHDVAALLVPSADPHLSEYLPEHWQGRQHFSGFTGSMGTLVVARDQAVLFADSRYWTQAEAELAGSGVELVRIPTGAATHHVDWLAEHVPSGATVAVDGAVLGLAAAQQLGDALKRRGIALRSDVDLLDEAWPDRPGLPAAAIYEHLAPHAAVPRSDKLAQLRAEMQRLGATHHLISTLDDIAWITNLRGADVDYNPVFLAHLLLDAQGGTLFVGAGKVSAELAERLAADGLRLAPYAQAHAGLAALPTGAVLLLDPKRVTLGLREAV
ncbi:MAG TPA: aminopeptidase P family N-terminal domain-containing protein, partial [Burkholderiaceae bacterium]|nr:aminopeptidase P family N-terminal domain-containing protein [Burkholderiaceae bacterium]